MVCMREVTGPLVYKKDVSAIFSNAQFESLAEVFERSQSCSWLCLSKVLVTSHVTKHSL